MVHCDVILTFIVSTVCCLVVNAASDRSDAEAELIQELDNVHKQVRSLTKSLRRLRSAVDNADCHMSVNAQLCRDSTYKNDLSILKLLQDPMNPGKRSDANVQNLKSKRFSQDAARKRVLLNEVQTLLYDIARRLHEERKRSCVLNLAYHCKTSEYSTITDFHNYLNSDASPGKRKRSVHQESPLMDA